MATEEQDFDDLVREWADNWPEREADLEKHPELLTEDAELVIFEPVVGFVGNPERLDLLRDFLLPWAVLRQARADGVRATYARLNDLSEQQDPLEVVLPGWQQKLTAWEAVNGWLAAFRKSPRDSMEYLQAHPETLSDDAEQFLTRWIQIQERRDLPRIAAALRERLELLRQSRTAGIIEAHNRLASKGANRSLMRLLPVVGLGVLGLSAVCCGIVLVVQFILR